VKPLRAAAYSLVTVALMVAAAACGTSSPTEPAGGAASEPKTGPLKISLLTTYNGLPFYTAMQCGALDAAKRIGGDIEVTSDGPPRGMNAADQIPVLESVVNRKPDGLIFVPADPKAMLAPIKAAISGGLPVVTTDAVLAEKVALAQFQGDNEAGGRLAAEEMLKQAGSRKGKVLVLDNRPGLPVTNQRAEGFIAALDGNPSLTLLPTQYFEDDPNKAATIVQSSLQANPDIVGIFATAEAGAMGAVSGLQAARSEKGKVSVIAYDAGPVLVRALKDGTLDALVAQGSYQQGYDALTRIVEIIRGTAPADASFDNVIDNVLVTRDNVGDPEIAKVLYPEKCP
jgi:ribose transport system substrate-binding protein